jgi:predicted dehydrogenase
MKKYKAAIIGCGRIGSEFDKKIQEKIALSHAGAYVLSARTELVAGCDPDGKKLKKFVRRWKIHSVYSDCRELLARHEIDIVSICTPPETHWPIVREVARFPVKAVYCEKPVSHDARSAHRMIELCRKRNILLMVNHQRRFDPFYRELKDKIAGGLLGEITKINCKYTRGIFNTGVHVLDLFVFLFGPVRWVHSGSVVDLFTKGDPTLDVEMRFRSGAEAFLQAYHDRDYLILEIEILGRKGRIRLSDKLEYDRAQKVSNLLNMKKLIEAKKPPLKNLYGPISLTHGVEHIVRCLENKDRPLSSGKQALHSLEVIEAVLRSSRAGTRVVV